jgi:hypothetical protein
LAYSLQGLLEKESVLKLPPGCSPNGPEVKSQGREPLDPFVT